MNTEKKNRMASNDAGARPSILYGNMLDQMRYFEALEYVRELDVLDIACGVGWGSYLLAKSGARTVYGIDLSEDALICAKKYYNCKNTTYILGNSKKIPLDSDSIDVIVSFETFEHVEDVSAFVAELYRVARSNALLILSTPNGYCTKKKINSKPENPFHFEEYLRKDIEGILSKKNWDIVNYKGQYPVKIKSKEINGYRRFIFYYWKLMKYESKFGFIGKVVTFLLRRSILSSVIREPAYKESCMPKEIKEGYEPITHFFIFKCLKS